MSALYFEREHQQALSDLADVQREDAYITTVHVLPDAKGRNAFSLQFWLNIYARYLHIARRLVAIHDAKLQAQQLRDVRTLLDACLGRMLEAKSHLVSDCGDFVPLDDTMLDLKRTPDELETPIPRYIRDDRELALEEQRNQIASLQAHYLNTEPDAPVSAALRLMSIRTDPTKALPPMATKKTVAQNVTPTAHLSPANDSYPNSTDSINIIATHTTESAAYANHSTEDDAYNEEQIAAMSINEAVQLLQVCERGRQARQRVRFQLSLYRQRRFAAEHGAEFSSVTGKDRAAAVVQAVVQGYLARKRAKERAQSERRFLGMKATAETASDAQERAARGRAEERKARQRLNMAELTQRTWAVRDELMTQEGPRAMEEMLDEVAMHMAYARMQSGGDAGVAAVDMPSAEEGGSLALLQRWSRQQPQSGGATTAPGEGGSGRNASVAGARKALGATTPSSRAGEDEKNANRSDTMKSNASADEERKKRGSRAAADASVRSAEATAATPSSTAAPLAATSNNNNRSSSKNNTFKSMSITDGASGGGGNRGGATEADGNGSVLWSHMTQGIDRYNTVWRDRFVRSYVDQRDWQQGTDATLLREELMSGPGGVMADLRRCVDELVLVEVNNLKERLRMQQAGGGGGGKAGAKKKKKKKGSGKGGSAAAVAPAKVGTTKKPKLRDPAKGVDVDTLLHTAVFENKLQLPPAPVRIGSLIGPESVMMSSLDRMAQEQTAQPRPSSSSPYGLDDEEEVIRKWQRILRNWNDEVEKALRMTRSDLESKLAQYVRQTPAQRLVQCDVGGALHAGSVASASAAAVCMTPPASVAQLRRAVVEYGILPLGSQVIHDMLPFPHRGLLLYGLPATGKTLAAFALCNEAGANFINLSPANFVVAKELGKVVRLMVQLARLRAPSIIYLDQVEKVFVARGAVKAKQAKRDPLLVRGKAIRKELLRGLRSLEPHDRVLLVAASSQPWDLDRAMIAEVFEHALYFSLPNYSTRQALLRHFITQAMEESESSTAGYTALVANAIHNDVGTSAGAAVAATSTSTTSFSSAAATVRPLPLSLPALQQLTMLCDGLSAGQIRTVVRRTLSPWRVEQLTQMPLTMAEFVNVLSNVTPASAAEVARIAAFHDQLPMRMRRALPATDFAPTEEELKNRKQKKKRKVAVSTGAETTRTQSDKDGTL